MKQIVKWPEPKEFSDWKRAFRIREGREPTYSDFRLTDEWSNLIQTLLKEQGYICCYCMKQIGEWDSGRWDSHMEHFVPRNIKNTDAHSIRAENVQLNYLNLFESCNGEHNAQDHCGHFKDREDSPMIICPTEPDIEERFFYDPFTGKIDAKDPCDQEVMTTIRILNLNSKKLRNHRLSAIYSSGIMDAKTEDERQQLMATYSSRNRNGAFAPYCAALTWLLKHMP